jgi:predicted ATPase
VIATPDRRVRVFVSSTLEELGRERAAAREAIEALRLTPVLFELGARPHAPRSVYRAYLEQSDVFVGIYGERYGWVAPGMDVSGLEDEYRLANSKPKLIYIRRPARDRDAQLEALIDGIRADGEVSYRGFSDPEELRRLLADDLALLLSERFQTRGEPVDGRSRVAVPAPIDPFVGRAPELAELGRLVRGRVGRLVTVTGAGGVGKTRLALEVVRRERESFAAGAHFVSLADVVAADDVMPAIARSLGLGTGSGDEVAALAAAVRDLELLLLLDNFEHVVTAAPDVGRLLEACDRLTVVATSREPLRIRGEREFRLSPMKLPEKLGNAHELDAADAVLLFVERARAASPAFALTGATRDAVAAICQRLDGLPLAIELAAARVGMLPPKAILDRLEQRLDLAAPARSTYPERQRTLRAAIDWSYDLLSADERAVYALASVFRGFTIEALNAVAGRPTFDSLASLVDRSLIVTSATFDEPRFSLSPTIAEHAREKLEETADAEAAKERHARFYADLAMSIAPRLRVAAEHEQALSRLDPEDDNIRAAIEWLLDHRAAARAADAVWSLLPYWLLHGRTTEARTWVGRALDAVELPSLSRARALAVAGVLAFWASDRQSAVPVLREAHEIFSQHRDEVGVALAQLPLGVIESMTDHESGLTRLDDSRRLFERANHEWGVAMTMFAMSWVLNASGSDAPLEFFEETARRAGALGWETETLALASLARRRASRGETREAKRLLAEALRRVRVFDGRRGVALHLELIADLAMSSGEDALATRLSAAAEAASEVGRPALMPLLAERETRRAQLRQRLGDDAYEREWRHGAARLFADATEEALVWAEA